MSTAKAGAEDLGAGAGPACKGGDEVATIPVLGDPLPGEQLCGGGLGGAHAVQVGVVSHDVALVLGADVRVHDHHPQVVVAGDRGDDQVVLLAHAEVRVEARCAHVVVVPGQDGRTCSVRRARV